MIASIRLNGRHKINVVRGKFKYKEESYSVKEVPVVRYKFQSYGMEEIKYIKSNMEKFNYSAHVAEVFISNQLEEELDRLSKVEGLKFILYLPINDDIITQGFNGDFLILLDDVLSNYIGEELFKIVLYDMSDILDMIYLDQLKLQLIDETDLDLEESDIGVCNSPLSFEDGNSCLTAVKCRELIAESNSDITRALPSAKHEDMNKCGCSRFINIEGDTDVIVDKARKKKEVTEDFEGESEQIKKKVKKKGLLRW